ncbi:hypothetical protein K2173_013045 [Erythroxylum novogranatense]|uniref:Bidirectional sugar transporter SWEET n=1 Tax=Erythroxylum novogranatense TaxID=1862640 RepID=A0AAV8S6R4_9ROSI|nr:hypothetical protein K2173_013045 [Erythroxylum novogranatense]
MGALRLAVGIMGNAASLSLFFVPILQINLHKSCKEEKYRGVFMCSLCYYTTELSSLHLVGMPVVSYKWENFPLVTINGLGILFEASFIVIYFWFASGRAKVKVAVQVLPAILLFIVIAAVSTFGFHDRPHRKLFVGCFGIVVAAAMYGSPLVAVKRVIETESVEFMPFYLSFFSFLASTLWMIFGLLSQDMFIASPNFVGSPLAILQLLLYFMYRKRGIMEEPKTWDLEKNKVQLHPVVDQTVNGKN